MTIDAHRIWLDVEKIRQESPLIHNITNYVVMNLTANALLSIGASPVMAHAEEEVADMVKIASALVINIGTLSEKWVNAMQRAIRQAKALDKPIILDPVGAGATPYRTETTRHLLEEAPPTILRGNASEIRAIVTIDTKTKGVDSITTPEAALEAARYLSQQYDCVVCISGKTDWVVQGNQLIKISNGHPLMPRVTGLGCTATALCGAFSAVSESAFQATVGAMATLGIAGELAAQNANGPASFQMHLLDALYNLKETDFTERLKLEIVS